MRFVHVQFLPSEHGVGCLSSVDLDLEGWDKAGDLQGSVCVWPDQVHNPPNDPNVQALITAWTAAGVVWVTTEEAVERGYRLTAPFQYFDRPPPPTFGARRAAPFRRWLERKGWVRSSDPLTPGNERQGIPASTRHP